MTHAQPPFFRALPAYLGGKRRLCPLIFSLIAAQVPRQRWADATLLDPFSGGGAVALYAKAMGFAVHASDIALRAVIPARALVANSQKKLTRGDVARPWGGKTSCGPPVFAVEAAKHVAPDYSGRGARLDSGLSPVR